MKNTIIATRNFFCLVLFFLPKVVSFILSKSPATVGNPQLKEHRRPFALLVQLENGLPLRTTTSKVLHEAKEQKVLEHLVHKLFYYLVRKHVHTDDKIKLKYSIAHEIA